MSAFCGDCNTTCNNDGSDIKFRGTCERLFHTKCVKDDVDFKKTRPNKEWKCKDCRAPSSTQGSLKTSGTSITKDFLITVLDDLKKEVFEELKIYKKVMGDVSASMQFLSGTVDTTNKLMQEIKQEIHEFKKEITELKADKERLNTEVVDLRERVRTLEQYTRRNNVEVSGIPVTPKENVINIVKDLGTALGLDTLDTDIAAAHRVPSFKKENIPSIVVQFQRISTRDTWIAHFKKNRSITAKKVNNVYSSNQLYVNEHLSPYNKVFLAKLKRKCKEVGYKYSWVEDGKFYVQKKKAKKLKITCSNDIEKL